MRPNDEVEDYITYTVVTCPAEDRIPADTAMIKIPKLYGRNAKAWLISGMRFKSLATNKR